MATDKCVVMSCMLDPRYRGRSARLVRDAMLEVAAGGRAPTGRAGACRVPDLGQVPQQDPRIVARGLVAVVALPGDRLHVDQQVRLPGGPGGQPPGAVPAGRLRPGCRGEGEPWPGPTGPAGGITAVRRAGFAASGRGSGFGSGAAVADRVPVLVGDRHAPGGPGVGGGAGQVAGQRGVDGADAGDLAGPVRQVEQGGQRDGQHHPAGESGRHRTGL